MKFKEFLKWVFRRWYFYLIFCLILLINIREIIRGFSTNFPEYSLGMVFGGFLISFLITGIFYKFRKQK